MLVDRLPNLEVSRSFVQPATCIIEACLSYKMSQPAGFAIQCCNYVGVLPYNLILEC